MIRRAIVLMVGAAFLLVVVAGCGSDPQPSIKNSNAPTIKKAEGTKPIPD